MPRQRPWDRFRIGRPWQPKAPQSPENHRECNHHRAMGSGVSVSLDSSEDTCQARPSSVMPATARFSWYHSNVTVSRSPTTMLIPRTTLETWAEGIAALISNRFSCIIWSQDAPVRSPGSSYSDHHLLKDTGLVGPKGLIKKRVPD